MSTTTTNRAQSIADFLLSVSFDARVAKQDVATKSEALQEAAAAATNAREGLMAAIANASHADAWTTKEVESATKLAAAKLNDKAQAKTFSTLASEIKLAADENVRGVFSDLTRLRDAVWNTERAEAEAAKKADMSCETPCKLAFARAYHMLVAMMRRVANPKDGDPAPFFSTTDSVLAFARANDPRRDPAKIERQIKSLVETLETFHGVFPVESVKTLLDYAGTFSAEGLKAELDALEAERAERDAAEAAAAEELAAVAEDRVGEVGDDEDHDGSETPSSPGLGAPARDARDVRDVVDELLAA